MMLLVVGASDRALAIVRTEAATRAVDLHVGTSPTRPDWVVTTTADERADAMRRYGLPAHRVIVLPELATEPTLTAGGASATLQRMVEVGPLPPPQRGPAAWLA